LDGIDIYTGIATKKIEYNYKGRSVLLLDGCSSHMSPKINFLCDQNHVDLIYLPAHTSDRTQPLDLLFFSVFKTHFAKTTVKIFNDKQSNDICRMTRALTASAAFDIIIQSFERVGIIPDFGTKDEVYFMVDLSKSALLTHLCTHQNYVQPMFSQKHLVPFPPEQIEPPMIFKIQRAPKQSTSPKEATTEVSLTSPGVNSTLSHGKSSSARVAIPRDPSADSSHIKKSPVAEERKKMISPSGTISAYFGKAPKTASDMLE
jgi:hypothetical protein